MIRNLKKVSDIQSFKKETKSVEQVIISKSLQYYDGQEDIVVDFTKGSKEIRLYSKQSDYDHNNGNLDTVSVLMSQVDFEVYLDRCKRSSKQIYQVIK